MLSVTSMRVTGWMIKLMGMGSTSTWMERLTKDSGRMINSMGKG
jgi:hypothetical protein